MVSGSFCRLGTLAGVAIAALQLPVFAQANPEGIRADGSLGTAVERIGADYNIGGGTFAPGDLNNLFHSFEQFNLSQGETATFENVINNVGVDIIFARVTGGSTSTIDGAINGGDVNFFLMNPDGLVFNENASLQIGRSFFGVTAGSISFFDNSRFTASTAEGVPTGETPFSFIFTGDNGDITVARNGTGGPADIEVDVDRTFALVGGNVRISDIDEIRAPSGRVEIVGIGSQPFLETPLFVDPNNDIGISFAFGAFPEGNGQVLIENSRIASEVDSFGLAPSLFFDSSSPGLDIQTNPDAGGVFIRASGEIVINNSNITAFTDTEANAGYVGLQTSSSGSILLSGRSTVFATVEPELDANGNFVSAPRGQGGTILVDTGDLTLVEASQLQTLVRDGVDSPDTFAGVVFIQATGDVSLVGSNPVFGTSIFSSVGGPNADSENTAANAGLVLLEANSLEVDGRDGFADITTSNRGQGGAGFIFIDVDTDVVVRGERGDLVSETTSSVPGTSATGGQQPGVILIEARRVGVLNDGSIRVDNQGTGSPGLLSIEADLIAANRSAEGLTARSTFGEGGLVLLDSQFVALANGSNVETTATVESGVSQERTPLKGIALFTDFEVIASPSADNNISTNADGEGAEAGLVFFISEPGVAPPFLRNIAVREEAQPTSNDITFEGTGGARDGAVLGEFSEFSSFQPTAEPPPETIDPSRLIAQGCAAGDLRAAQNIGNLTLTGREGLSATPEEQLATGSVAPADLAGVDDGADLAQADAWVAAASGDVEAASDANNTVEAQTWRYGSDGQVILAALTNHTYAPVFPGLTCNAL